MQHQPWLRNLARSVVGEHEADDLVQEVFLKVVHRPPNLHGPAKSWLSSVLRNAARMRFRSEGRRQERDKASVEFFEEEASLAALPSERVERTQFEGQVQAMVSKLPVPYRETVVGIYEEGLTAAELAEKQGLKAATVRQRHKKALSLLRRQLPGKSRPAQLRSWFTALLPAAVGEMSSPFALELYEFGILVL